MPGGRIACERKNAMAKVKKNIVMNRLSGTLGDQVVLKRDKAARTILSVKPTFPEDREFSDAQKEARGRIDG
jgi:hypothetical protein